MVSNNFNEKVQDFMVSEKLILFVALCSADLIMESINMFNIQWKQKDLCAENNECLFCRDSYHLLNSNPSSMPN